jgi:hypothetical protein
MLLFKVVDGTLRYRDGRAPREATPEETEMQGEIDRLDDKLDEARRDAGKWASRAFEARESSAG